MGYDYLGSLNQDFWEYDPATNTWTQKADFVNNRNTPLGFSIGNKGYAGMGETGGFNYQLDIWEYNPVTNFWTQKQDFAGQTRITQSVFSIGNFAYVGLGYVIGLGYIDFFKYDKINNTWTQVADFPGLERGQAASFSIGNYGYVGTGNRVVFPSAVLKDFWRYDPVANTWQQKADFGGLERDEATFFSINNKGYIGLGTHNGQAFYNDFWEYTPDSTTSIEETPNNNFQFTISPNPAKEFIVCSLQFTVHEKINLSVTDINGREILFKQLKTEDWKPETNIDVSNFSNGIYFVTIDDGKQKAVKKFLKE